MTTNKHNNKRAVWLSLALLVWLVLFPVCAPPAPLESANRKTYTIEIAFYPGKEIIYYDTFGLFSTTVVIPALDSALRSFNIVLFYDNTLVEYESVSSKHNLISTRLESGALRIEAKNAGIAPGDYIELCTVTWKAVATGFTDVKVQVEKMVTSEGLPVYMKSFTDTVKIVKEMGALSFEGDPYIEKNTNFSKPLLFSDLDKNIKEYDINIYYDPVKIRLDANTGNQGISAGADGFINTVSPGDGVINVTGVQQPDGGAGGNGEFLVTNWVAGESGRTTISLEINKLVVMDNVYIKPELRASTLSIYSGSNKPTVDIWLEPAAVTAAVNSSFTSSVVLKIDSYVLAAYGIDILYDSAVMELDKSQANGAGIIAGKDGFLTVVNSLVPGQIRTAGFDLKGKAPNPQLELLKIYWKALSVAVSSEIVLDVKNMSDIRSREIDRIRSFNSSVTVSP